MGLEYNRNNASEERRIFIMAYSIFECTVHLFVQGMLTLLK